MIQIKIMVIFLYS